jgi:heme exporter protein C
MDKPVLTYVAIAAAAVLTLVDFVMAFFVTAPVLSDLTVQGIAKVGTRIIGNAVLFSQKIFYFHVPVAITSFVVFFFVAYFSVRFLMTKDKAFDTKARLAMEVTLLFIVLTMITGDIWTRVEWGTWWVWEPRLTTYFIMMLLVIAYFVLRSSIEDEERRATYAAVFGIVAFIDAPISFAITRIVPSAAHPVVIRVGGGLDVYQSVAFTLGIIGMLCLGFAIYQLRSREEGVRERIEALKTGLEG